MQALREAGHQCALLATSTSHGLAREEREGITVWRAGLKNLYYPTPATKGDRPVVSRALWHLQDSYNPWMQRAVRRVVMSERPDVACVHNICGWSAAIWGTLHRLHVPAVQVLHDYYGICPKSTMYRRGENCSKQCRDCALLRLPHRRLSRRVSAVVGVSQFVLKQHLSLGYFDTVKLRRVIHNVLPLSKVPPPHMPLKPEHLGVRFGFIGRLSPVKGVDRLIRAFSRLGATYAELWVAGDGGSGYARELQSLAEGARVRFLGRVAATDFYKEVDVVLVPSAWNDPLPTVVIEAFASGRPVIATRRGGIPELIEDGENGLLVNPDDPDELYNAMRRLQVDDGLRQRLAAGASRAALRHLDVRGWASQYTRILEEVVQASRQPSAAYGA